MQDIEIPQTIKNPLSIIALFITLIYSMTSLVTVTSNSLSHYQKWFFVYFLVIFPIIIFFTFIFLVVKHGGKLYSPKDFRTDEAFERMNSKKIESKIKNEIEEVVKNEELIEETPGIELFENIQFIDKKLKYIENFYKENEKDNLYKYFNTIEKCAIEYLKSNYTNLKSYPGFKFHNYYISFDAISRNQFHDTVFEIKIFRKNILKTTFKNFVIEFHNKLLLYQENIGRPVDGQIVIVSDFSKIETPNYKNNLTSELTQLNDTLLIKIRISFLDLEELNIS